MFDSDKKIRRRKPIRVEYKILIFFVVIFLVYVAYDAIFGSVEGGRSMGGGGSSVGREVSPSGKSKRSISEAVTSDRPLVIDTEQIKEDVDKLDEDTPQKETPQKLSPKDIEDFRLGDKEIESIEKASESATPTIWIYVRNNGARRDDMAARYCREFHSNGIKARAVMILDSDAKKRGRFIELGEKKCN